MKKRFLAVTMGIIAAFGVLALGACKKPQDETPPPSQELPDPPPVNGLLAIAGLWSVYSLMPIQSDPAAGPPQPFEPQASQYRIEITEEGAVTFTYSNPNASGESVVYNGTAVMSENYAYSFTFSGTAGGKSLSATATYDQSRDEIQFGAITLTQENGTTTTPYNSALCRRYM